MAYTIKRTDGTTLAVIADGSANTSTDLTLIGKNYLNYGTALNENLIRLLESFANTTAPTKPIRGQLWYDTANSDLKIYNGTSWVFTTTNASAISATGTINAGNLNTTGTLNATGNANVGNLGTSGLIVATGNIDGGNLNTAGVLSVTGNANVGNLGTGIVIATGNIAGANINTAGTVTASRLISNVATGTSPLVVSSTTRVANLNVAVAGSLVNGNSNVVVDANANVRVSTAGNANIFVVNGTGVVVTGTANITGNANVGNLGTAGSISVTGNANVGNLGVSGAATVSGNLTVNAISNLGAIANVRVTGGTSGQIITTDGAGNLSFTSISAGTSIVNGNSNVVVSANSNVTVAVAGATTGTFTSTGLVIVGNLTPSANVTYSLGNNTNRWSNIWGVSSSAQYADLAEKYHSDEVYGAGTVMSLGGENEITKSVKDLDENVFGVVSTNPAYLMNDNNSDPLWLPIVLTGRANVMVTGTVSKGQWLVSAGDGTARGAREGEARFNLVIGRSLVNKTVNTPALVEAYISTK